MLETQGTRHRRSCPLKVAVDEVNALRYNLARPTSPFVKCLATIAGLTRLLHAYVRARCSCSACPRSSDIPNVYEFVHTNLSPPSSAIESYFDDRRRYGCDECAKSWPVARRFSIRSRRNFTAIYSNVELSRSRNLERWIRDLSSKDDVYYVRTPRETFDCHTRALIARLFVFRRVVVALSDVSLVTKWSLTIWRLTVELYGQCLIMCRCDRSDRDNDDQSPGCVSFARFPDLYTPVLRHACQRHEHDRVTCIPPARQ